MLDHFNFTFVDLDNTVTGYEEQLEFVEGVARTAFQLFLNTLPEDARDKVDYKAMETQMALKEQLESLIAHIKELINSGTFS